MTVRERICKREENQETWEERKEMKKRIKISYAYVPTLHEEI